MATRNKLRDILKAWDIGEVCETEKLYKDTVFRVVTTQGVLVLKDLGESDRGLNRNLLLQYDILQHLDARDVPVAVPIKDRVGNVSVSHQGHLFVLLPRLPNGPRPTAQENRVELYHNYGVAIAKLHLALLSFPVSKFEGKTWRTDPANEMFRDISVIKEHIDGARLSVFESMMTEMTEDMHAALDGLDDQLIHRDCHPGNVLNEGIAVTGFVDCDHLSFGPRILDLAYFTIHFVMRQTDDVDLCRVWLEEFPFILEGYETIAKLSEKEKKAFPYAMVFVLLLFASFLYRVADGKGAHHQLDALEWVYSNLEVICKRSLSMQ